MADKARSLAVSRWLRGLAIAIPVLLVGITGQQLWTARSNAVDGARTQMARLDMLLAEQTGRTVESIDQVLRDTISTRRLLQDRGMADSQILAELLRERGRTLHQLAGVAVLDASCELIGWSAADPDPALRLAAQTAAGRLKPSAELQVSAPFKVAGRWYALLARAGDGPQANVVVAGLLDLRYFEDFYRAVQLTEQGAILLHRRDGIVLARFPAADALIGTSYADLPPFHDVLAHDIAGTLVMNSPLDGSRRVLAIRALKAFPLATNVSVGLDEVLRPWRMQALFFGPGAVVTGLVIGGLLWTLARRVRAREAQSEAVARARDRAENTSERLTFQIAERERAEEALRQSQRIEAVGQLTGGVAHDFNNLLTVVIGSLDLLEMNNPVAAGARPHLQAIRTAAERGATLTNQLLAFARQQPLAPRAVDLHTMLTTLSEVLRAMLGAAIRLELRVPETWPAMVDATQLELVVLNLALNARDAMPGGGVLRIETQNVTLGAPNRPEHSPDQLPAGDYVVLAVLDSGSGMTPEVRARAFEPFFTTKGPAAGSGLGLSQVYGLARQSGGMAEIESEVDIGTTVRVYLPRADLVVPRATARSIAAPAGSGGRIVLVVDDNADVRSITASILDSLGYTAIEAGSGSEALDVLLRAEPVDLLLTDVVMADMDGPHLARRARQLRRGLPVVFMSGFSDVESFHRDGDPGERLLGKPFRPAELREQLEAALAGAAASAAAPERQRSAIPATDGAAG